MFADYRVPQALYAVGALKYSYRLFSALCDTHTRYEHGSREEMEIRGCSIWAVEVRFISLPSSHLILWFS